MSTELKIGHAVGGCRVEEEVGRGGMGIVYRCTELPSGSIVALKLLSKGDEKQVERFIREASMIIRLSDRNVIRVDRFGRTEGGLLYIVMEFVNGGSIEDVLRRDAVLPEERALSILAQAASGLSAAARKGIVHRDVKPANLMLTTDGTVKVADFGLAKQLTIADGISITGEVIGTPQYMSPEQAAGEPVALATDVWSLGVVFFRMLTGQLPFFVPRNVLATLALIRECKFPYGSLGGHGVSARSEAMLRHMTAKSASDRYASCEVLLEEIRTPSPAPKSPNDTLSGLSAVQDAPTEARTPSPSEPAAQREDEIDEIERDLNGGFAASVSDALVRAVSLVQLLKPPSEGNRRLITLALKYLLSTKAKTSRDMERCLDVLRLGGFTDENAEIQSLWRSEAKKQPTSIGVLKAIMDYYRVAPEGVRTMVGMIRYLHGEAVHEGSAMSLALDTLYEELQVDRDARRLLDTSGALWADLVEVLHHIAQRVSRESTLFVRANAIFELATGQRLDAFPGQSGADPSGHDRVHGGAGGDGEDVSSMLSSAVEIIARDVAREKREAERKKNIGAWGERTKAALDAKLGFEKAAREGATDFMYTHCGEPDGRAIACDFPGARNKPFFLLYAVCLRPGVRDVSGKTAYLHINLYYGISEQAGEVRLYRWMFNRYMTEVYVIEEGPQVLPGAFPVGDPLVERAIEADFLAHKKMLFEKYRQGLKALNMQG